MEWTSLIHTERGWEAYMRVSNYLWVGMNKVRA